MIKITKCFGIGYSKQHDLVQYLLLFHVRLAIKFVQLVIYSALQTKQFS